VLPRGSGSRLEIGAPPRALQLIVSTEHLNEVLDHDEGNATVAAGAGIALFALDEIVGRHKQFIPLQYADRAATLGGAVATNEAGATKLKYGAPRDLVVGLHAVLSDGRAVRAGSKVVKNVSGYDLNKLFIGSFGTLGLITRVTMRLRPNDASQAHWSAACASWSEAVTTAFNILDGDFEPTLLRVICSGDALHVQARFDGVEAAVQAQMARVGAGAGSIPTTDSDTFDHSHAVQLCAVLPLRRAAEWAQEAQAAGAKRILWDCGTGTVRATFGSVPDIAALRASAERRDGFVVAERAPHDIKTAELVWGARRSDHFLMQRLKEKFDAADIFAPGRFAGGL
jgi:glycolate oxidase FAD binding subunit